VTQRKKGFARLSINEWLSYFSLRMNQIKLRGGREVSIMIEPVQHVASNSFKELPISTRGCLLENENQG
jgi:hypothetical protein